MIINPQNITKALVICALLNVIYTFYLSSTALQSQLSINGQELGRIEAFMNAMETTVDFWPHIIEGWAYGFGISFFSCMLLLAWISVKVPGKSDSPDAKE